MSVCDAVLALYDKKVSRCEDLTPGEKKLVLGKGGFGMIIAHPTYNHIVYKFSKDTWSTTREIFALRTINSSLLAHTDVYVDEDKVVLPLLRGVPLTALIKKRMDISKNPKKKSDPNAMAGTLGRLDVEGKNVHMWAIVVASVLRHVLGDMATAHRHNIAHRDIKPQNIIICGLEDDMRVTEYTKGHLADWGWAEFDASIASDLPEREQITNATYLLSPEQICAPASREHSSRKYFGKPNKQFKNTRYSSSSVLTEVGKKRQKTLRFSKYIQTLAWSSIHMWDTDDIVATTGPPLEEHHDNRISDVWAFGLTVLNCFWPRMLEYCNDLRPTIMLQKYLCLFGPPSTPPQNAEQLWPGLVALHKTWSGRIPEGGMLRAAMKQVLPPPLKAAIDFVLTACEWWPSKRPTASKLLHHPYFKTYPTHLFHPFPYQVMLNRPRDLCQKLCYTPEQWQGVMSCAISYFWNTIHHDVEYDVIPLRAIGIFAQIAFTHNVVLTKDQVHSAVHLATTLAYSVGDDPDVTDLKLLTNSNTFAGFSPSVYSLIYELYHTMGGPAWAPHIFPGLCMLGTYILLYMPELAVLAPRKAFEIVLHAAFGYVTDANREWVEMFRAWLKAGCCQSIDKIWLRKVDSGGIVPKERLHGTTPYFFGTRNEVAKMRSVLERKQMKQKKQKEPKKPGPIRLNAKRKATAGPDHKSPQTKKAKAVKLEQPPRRSRRLAAKKKQ